MPTISAPAKVLVTGANGFIGLNIVRRLLERGYSVRAAVRSQEKGESVLKAIARRVPDKAHNVEYAVVSDITADHAFDEAVKGVAGVVHTASPLTYSFNDPNEAIGPAVNGTLGVLKSAAAHGKDVKRVVITSSIRCIVGTEPREYTEADWNEAAVTECEEKGKDASGEAKYSASKLLAERAAWKFLADHKAEISWDIVALNPGWVFGPPVNKLESPQQMIEPMMLWFQQVLLVNDSAQVIPPGMNYVDVRDVAEGHIRALEVEEAGGERFLITCQWCTWKDWKDAARDLNLVPKVEKTYTGEFYTPPPEKRRTFSNEKIKKVLGIKFRTIPETLRDTLDDFRQRGWLAQFED